jgi:hypothetical protein
MAISGGSDIGGESITVARLIEMLKHIEWECRFVRLAVQQLEPQTRITSTTELKGLLEIEPPLPKYIDPPC